MIISRDKSLLCPAFAGRLVIFERRLQEASLPFFMFMGLRIREDQEELWNQGRTTPGPPCRHGGILFPIGTCQKHPLGLTVTNARAGDSMHQYALAADYVRDGDTGKPGIQWSWAEADEDHDHVSDWLEMGTIAEECGLEWGGRWRRFPDRPHVQMTFGLTLADIKELYRQGGVKRVWEECRI